MSFVWRLYGVAHNEGVRAQQNTLGTGTGLVDVLVLVGCETEHHFDFIYYTHATHATRVQQQLQQQRKTRK